MGVKNMPKEDSLFVSFDSNNIDEPCLTVTRKRFDGSVDVVSFLYGKAAIDVYKKLISNDGGIQK